LAAGTAAQASFSALAIGLPVLAPTLRDAYDLSLAGIGIVLASQSVGTLVTLLPWGMAADRVGERTVLAVGLGACGGFLWLAAHASGPVSLVALLALAGAAGASVNSASGRAVMQWFGEGERGLALGVRQTAIPLGGLTAAAVLPALSLDSAFLFLGAVCLAGAGVGVVVLREGDDGEETVPGLGPTLRDRRLWRLCLASGLYLVAQVALIGFLVLFLHDERGLSNGRAASVLAAVQILAGVLRIGAGRWSDALRLRMLPLRRIGVATAVTVAAAAVLLSAPLVLLLPALVAAGGLSMAWNGLSFTAAAELAGRARSGAAIGFQQSVLSAIGAGAPVVFAATVSATSWQAAFAFAAAFPLAGALLLRPLSV
jgi:sugar phosphate permease